MRRLLGDIAEGRILEITTLADPGIIENLKIQYTKKE